MKAIVTVHGIGNHTPDYQLEWSVENSFPGIIKESFYYEDVSDNHLWTKFLKLGLKSAVKLSGYSVSGAQGGLIADYAADILLVFLNDKARNKIVKKLADKVAFLQDQGATEILLVGHSMGSIVAYLMCMQHPGLAKMVTLATIGSPMGSTVRIWKFQLGLGRIVRFFLKNILNRTYLERPKVIAWYNIYSTSDPISGYIDALGCTQQHKTPNYVFHSEAIEYLKTLRTAMETNNHGF